MAASPPNYRAPQANRPVEYEVKAAFLYNFSKFVKWPASATAGRKVFDICILGRDPFGASLDAILKGESVDARPVQARRLSNARDARDCQIVFISDSEERRLRDVLAALSKTNTLTVSDISGFSETGGMIEFVVANNRVRFEINLTTAEGAGLMLSSDLLRVAASVRRTPGD